jgi:hypothetical protein
MKLTHCQILRAMHLLLSLKLQKLAMARMALLRRYQALNFLSAMFAERTMHHFGPRVGL